MINTIINKIKIWHCIAIIIIGILIRLFLFPYKVGDYIYYFEPWFVFIKSHGGFQSLKFNFYNYSPAYIYFCALIVKLNLNSLFAIKALSVIFELFAAYHVALLVNLKYNNKKIIWLVIAIFSIMPTFIINSSYWSQSDSIYSAFTIASVYYAIKKKYFAAIIFFSIAFSFKMQAIFISPFFFLLFLKNKIKWYYFIMIPLIYIITIIPTWIAGRPFLDLITIFVKQSTYYESLTMNFPNYYIFINNNYYEPVKYIGIITTFLFVLFTTLLLKSNKWKFNKENWIKFAYISVVITTFLLPGMHERYLYLADVLGIVFLLYFPQKWYIPITLITVSTYSYIRCSRLNEILPQEPAFILFLLMIIFLISDFYKNIKPTTLEKL